MNITVPQKELSPHKNIRKGIMVLPAAGICHNAFFSKLSDGITYVIYPFNCRAAAFSFFPLIR